MESLVSEEANSETENHSAHLAKTEKQSDVPIAAQVTESESSYEESPRLIETHKTESDNDIRINRVDWDLSISEGRSFGSNQNGVAITDVLVKDLLSLTYLRGSGFQQMYGSVDINEVKLIVHNRCVVMEYEISSYLENCSRIAVFSLGIELFVNFEQYELIHLYFSYYDPPNAVFKNVLYKVIKKEEYDFKDSTKNLCMDNCIAIITYNMQHVPLNSDSDANSEKPNFPSFGWLLTNLLKKVFAQEDVAAFFENIYEKKNLLMTADRVLMAPEISPQCPWTKLNFLNYILVHGDFKVDLGYQDTLDQIELAGFCDYISPFKVILEIVADEQLPLCSIIRPLVSKLIKEHFSVYIQQNKLVQKVEPLIITELTMIIEDDFKKDATFFDVRFLNISNSEAKSERDAFIKSVKSKFGSIMETISYSLSTCFKRDEAVSSRFSSKTSLKSLFDPSADDDNSSDVRPRKIRRMCKTNIDVEFERYFAEDPLDLELSPLEWWKVNNIKYSELSKVAKYYLNVPCCIPKLDCIDPIEKNAILKKRAYLSYNSVESYLWYLHFNESFYEYIKCA